MNDLHFLKIAIKEAEKSPDGIGALIVRDGEIISIGINLSKKDVDPTSHAEIVAIRKACKKIDNRHLENCILYCNVEPCFMCLDATYWARIKKILYSIPRKEAKKVKYHTLNYTIQDLNSHFDEPLEIIEIKTS